MEIRLCGHTSQRRKPVQTHGKVTDGNWRELSRPHQMIQAVFADLSTEATMAWEAREDLCYQVLKVVVGGWKGLTAK